MQVATQLVRAFLSVRWAFSITPRNTDFTFSGSPDRDSVGGGGGGGAKRTNVILFDGAMGALDVWPLARLVRHYPG